jgi:hypothetical protein
MPQVESQIIVPADHVNLHRHPESILEVRRILLEQLADLQAFPTGRRPRLASQSHAHASVGVSWTDATPNVETGEASTMTSASGVLSR